MKVHESLPPLAPAGKRGARRRRKGRKLALRLHARRDATPRFLTGPDMPFTDKEAGRALRMMKRRQKISGGFRSASSVEEFATLRTIVATAQKQGRRRKERNGVGSRRETHAEHAKSGPPPLPETAASCLKGSWHMRHAHPEHDIP